ncbi:MAG: hypothetical protein LT070_02590 [Solirubrobacteraceae bacterium]|nr:hypothetical protein [Solirubrobacteraceae bacterium]
MQLRDRRWCVQRAADKLSAALQRTSSSDVLLNRQAAMSSASKRSVRTLPYALRNC